MSRKPAAVQVPGSTSNLGSGFDTLGLALKLYNTVRVTPIAGKGVVVSAPRDAHAEGDDFDWVADAAAFFFDRTKSRPFGIEISMRNEIPMARGLGYSASVRVGVVAALNEVAQTCLTREQLLEFAVALEGHPDNASPAVFGGFTASGMVRGGVRCLHFAVNPKLKFITLIPPFKVNTGKARRLMPASYVQADAAHALNRASLITAAFARNDFESLRGLFDDRMHQPYREELIPQLSPVIRAGERAGAIGGFLSGSGSSIISVALGNARRVAAAMKEEMPEAEVRILSADNAGFRLLA